MITKLIPYHYSKDADVQTKTFMVQLETHESESLPKEVSSEEHPPPPLPSSNLAVVELPKNAHYLGKTGLLAT